MESSARARPYLSETALNGRMIRAAETLSRPAQWRWFNLLLIANDLALTMLAFAVAYALRFRTAFPLFQLDVLPSTPFYRGISFILLPVWLGIFALNGLYQRRNLLGGTDEYSRVFRATSAGMLLVVVAGFLQPELYLARGWILMAWLFSFWLVSFGRFMLRRLVYYLRQHGYFLTPALIVGTNQEARLLAEQLLRWRTSGLYLVGFVDPADGRERLIHQHLRVLGNAKRLDQLIQQHEIEELILANSSLSRADIVRLFKRYALQSDLNLRMSSGFFELITTGLEVNELAYVPLVRVRKVRLTGADRLMKFALDYGLTVPGVLALLPVFLILALLIRLDSPGPVIYRRRVMGLNGRQFDAFKFRTMHVDGDELLADHPELQAELAENHKLKDDPRITRVGYYLRKFSLDELPQLFNILRHEMSLVGPRMISPPEMARYAEQGMNLLTVRPGITGLWQVSGRSDISYEERVRLDMHYIRNWTIWLDLQLLWQTIPAVVMQRGAY